MSTEARTSKVQCDCAATPPTMPTFRKTHLPTCPEWVVENVANIQQRVDEPIALRTPRAQLIARLRSWRCSDLDVKDAATALEQQGHEIERLQREVEALKTYPPMLFDRATGTLTPLVVPPKHPLAGEPGVVVNQPVREAHARTERPWGWYREIRPGTFTVEKGDWPPPEPDDTAWYPLYSAPMTSRESPR